ncbi:MAG: hypothetical protein K6E56_07260 [Lachnospiraceae bacterium]|nr:hypothetical protein [Lachnospiraceae bacterium]
MKIKEIVKKSIVTAIMASMLLTGCSFGNKAEEEAVVSEEETVTYENSEDGGHAILADGETAEYSNATVLKTGDSEGDEADFYGENAAVFATNGANLTLSEMTITTDGTHANAVFSYGEGTVVNISDSTIETSGNCSGGIMTTGGGTMNASNLTIHTIGRSSASIRSDRGGGTVTVNGGTYTTDGTGSPAIYSTADITVNDATLTSTASQGVVVEGKNSVTLNNVTLSADNNQHNSDKSDVYEAVMIYQSMSGDAATGLAEFSATGGSITNANGDIFFVNNTATDITLSGVEITNNGGGAFLRAAAAGWGSEGSNGGKVNLTATSQTIDGDMIADDISILNLYLKEGSTFNGAINSDGAAGDVYVELTGDSKWVLTGDSYITSLSCDSDSINLNGHTLYVNGKAYTEGTAVTGEAIEITISEDSGDSKQAPGGDSKPSKSGDSKSSDSKSSSSSSGSSDNTKEAPSQDENAPTPPDGEPPQGGDAPTPPDGNMTTPPDGEPPEKPDGNSAPPDKPDGEQSATSV